MGMILSEKGVKQAPEPLEHELEVLREMLERVSGELHENKADTSKLSMAASRLADAIGRAELTQQKLAAGKDLATELRAENYRLLRSLGLGEPEDEP
jgi:hypothetical protein